MKKRFMRFCIKGHLAKENLKSGIKTRTVNALKNEKGSTVIGALIFAAIMILAIVATKVGIVGGFQDASTKFRTWFGDRIDSVLKSDTTTL